jgi:uncharacterized protein YabE (DUF348 family)
MSDDKSRRRGRLSVVIAVLVVVSLVASGFVWAHKKVHIIADGRNLDIRTLHSKPEDVLAQAGIQMDSRDEYRLSTAKLQSGTTISVCRAVPVTVMYQGKTETVTTAKLTAGELAAAMGIAKSNVKIIPGEDTPVTANMQIKAITITESYIEKEMPVLYPVVRQPDPTLEKGDERVVEEGQDGRKTVKIKQVFEDGVQTAEETVQEHVIEEAKANVIHVGTRDMVETSRGDLRFRRIERMEATAYLPTDGGGHGITASGIAARNGVVAVDPRVIPLGSRLYIPGYGLALAADTGGDIIGHRIDLCMEDESSAWRFGRRPVKVYVLD